MREKQSSSSGQTTSTWFFFIYLINSLFIAIMSCRWMPKCVSLWQFHFDRPIRIDINLLLAICDRIHRHSFASTAHGENHWRKSWRFRRALILLLLFFFSVLLWHDFIDLFHGAHYAQSLLWTTTAVAAAAPLFMSIVSVSHCVANTFSFCSSTRFIFSSCLLSCFAFVLWFTLSKIAILELK